MATQKNWILGNFQSRKCATIVLAVVLILASFAPKVLADSIDDKQRALDDLQHQIKDKEQKISQTQDSIKTLQDQVNEVQAQIDLTETAIRQTQAEADLTNAQIDQTTATIDQKNQDLVKQKAVLGDTLVEMYQDGDQSELEMLVSNTSLNDFFTRDLYFRSVKDKTDNLMAQITKIKADLEAKKRDLDVKKRDLEQIQADQKSKETALGLQKSGKDQLLGQQQSENAGDLAAVDNLLKQKEVVSQALAEQRRQEAQSKNQIIVGSGTGGYPYYPCDMADQNGFLTCQCTSYAAWRFNSYNGAHFYNINGHGNATDWVGLANALGYSVGSTPQVGAIAMWYASGSSMPYGHVAFVESVNSDGTFNVSEFNWFNPEGFDERGPLSSAGAFIYP